MTLQPLMLWGLAAAALPVVIHLLNRLRFRSLPWGAMMFLIRATRTSTKRARLRHWLIRQLSVLCRRHRHQQVLKWMCGYRHLK